MTLFISAISGAIGLILSKIVLTRRHMSVHIFAPLLFLFLFLITAISVPWIGRFDIAQALTLLFIGYFLLMVSIAGVWNVFYYRAIKNETIQEFEIIILFVPLVTTLMSALFLPDERNIRVLIAALLASAALVLSHLEKRHFKFTPYSNWLFLGVVLISLESIITKKLLGVWSPAALYTARTFYVFLFLTFLSRPSFKNLTPKSFILTVAAALSGVVYMVTKFYGYQTLGIIYTTLVLVLEPLFTLILDRLVLKEKFKPRFLVAAVVIIVAVLYGTIIK